MASFAAATTTVQTTTTASTSTTTTTTPPPTTTTGRVIENAIEITKLWNGTELENESDRVVLKFTNTDENELQVKRRAYILIGA